jgi:hypothetical protein
MLPRCGKFVLSNSTVKSALTSIRICFVSLAAALALFAALRQVRLEQLNGQIGLDFYKDLLCEFSCGISFICRVAASSS